MAKMESSKGFETASMVDKPMRKNKGFTLIEIVVAVVIMGVLGIFGYHFLSTSVHTYSMMEKQKSLYDQAAMAMERISRELRDASTVTTATSSTLEFTKIHGSPEDGTIDITFQLSGTTLQREGVSVAENSMFNVSRNGDEITIGLTLSETTGESITLRSYVCPKNLPYPDPDAPSGRNFGDCWEEDFQ